MFPPLPATFASTRESLRALACFVMAPAYKARTGHIGLRPVGGGFGTPPLDDGSRLVVHGRELAWVPGESIPLTTLRTGARFAGIDLSADPGVGNDLPPYAPDADLEVDDEASLALGSWYAFGARVLDGVPVRFAGGTVGPAQIWPEHFDLAVTVEADRGATTNVGFSPGDGFSPEPYVYVGPHATDGLSDPYWNAPFGAFVAYPALSSADDPDRAALDFIVEGLQRAASPA